MGPDACERSVIARSWVMLALEPRQARKGATVVVFGRCLGHLAITVPSWELSRMGDASAPLTLDDPTSYTSP
jgi:hypothetical protein